MIIFVTNHVSVEWAADYFGVGST